MSKTIPLFPLGIVLFPNMVFPLHIFEDRYKVMVKDCLENKLEMGIAYYNGKKIKEIGCSAHIIEQLKVSEGGNLDLLAEGQKKFRILEFINGQKPYMMAKVEFLNDEPEDDHELLNDLSIQVIGLLKKMMGQYMHIEDFPDLNGLSPEIVSFLMASGSGFTHDEKQAFLEINKISERLALGVKALEKLLERVKMTVEIENIIQGNGHKPKPSTSEL